MTQEQLDKLREWLKDKVEASQDDPSGSNDFHAGVEGAYENVLEYLEKF
jgi:hypothetical protein